jgi:hypothetical protein
MISAGINGDRTGRPALGRPVMLREVGCGLRRSYCSGAAGGGAVVKVFSADVVWPLALLTTMT